MVSDIATEALTYFMNAATVDPLSGALLVFGNLILLVAVGIAGVLAVGGIVAGLRPR